ncbi:MAG: cytochrome C [Gammaproteobacteria bacterium]|nr:cytochrome C [Gammaproteobacteria bacterium]
MEVYLKSKNAVIFAFIFVFFHAVTLAVPAGKIIEFTKNPMGIVIFSGKIHAEKGLKCNACHPSIFSLKKGTAEINLVDHKEGNKYCFLCHNGTKAFAVKDNCNRCHIKEK